MTEQRGGAGETTDVVVVGGGLAGHAAALAAADAGAEVVLLEKCAEFGGSSAMAGGGLALAGTELQRQEGVADTPEDLRADLLAAGRGHSHEELVDTYVWTQQETYTWLCGLGAEFSLTGAPVRRLHTMPSGALVALLHRRVETHENISYRHLAAADTLLTADRWVGGVAVRGAEGVFDLRARRAVILANGGFSRNRQLVSELAPAAAGAVAMGGTGNEGDGLTMARAVGADLAGMEFVEASFGASVRADVETRLLYAQSDGAVIVNSRGDRFAGEDEDIKALGRAVAQQPGRLAYQLFDHSTMRKSRTTPKPRDFAAALRDGLLYQAPSITELAEAISVPPTAVAEAMKGLTEAPFYAFACTAGLTSTYGGLRVNGRLEVLDTDGHPIDGLFAAGEVVGGFHGAGYLIGSALGKAAVFGYAAGRTAAARPPHLMSADDGDGVLPAPSMSESGAEP